MCLVKQHLHARVEQMAADPDQQQESPKETRTRLEEAQQEVQRLKQELGNERRLPRGML